MPLDTGDHLMRWSVFLFFWRLLGWLLYPFLRLHPRFRYQPRPEPGAVWIHGASLGEHRAVSALCSKIKQPLWRSHSTWRSRVNNSFPAPLDLPWIIEEWLDWARPRALVLVEAELWPGWIEGCRKRGIPIHLVNYRPSRSTVRWCRLGLWEGLTKGITILSQEEYGDLKGEAELPETNLRLPQPCLIAASTRKGDEETNPEGTEECQGQPLPTSSPPSSRATGRDRDSAPGAVHHIRLEKPLEGDAGGGSDPR